MLTRPPPDTAQTVSRKKARTSTSLRLPLSVALACIYPAVHSLPQNPDVAAGSVSISTSDRAMQINQATDKAIIDWQKFGIGPNESVSFNQPSRASVVLNRVTGAGSSALDGMLNANGQVFLVNPNGVLIGPTARINVSGLLASTLDVENQRFLRSDYTFTAKSNPEKASVINDGAITAVDGGYIVMLSNNVRNNGMIDAPSGHVLMGAGSQATLYISNQSLLGYRIDAGAAAALVDNVNRIRADGGQVSLAARGLSGASQLASAAVNNSGIIEARTLDGKPGAIALTADMQNGRVYLNGTLDASASSGTCGTIETTASVVSVGSNAQVTAESLSGQTGLWTVTSDNPVIGRNLNNISNTALSTSLDRINVTVVASGGNLSVDREIASQGGNRLELKAANNLLIDAPVTVGNGGVLAHAGTNGAGVGKVTIATNASVRASEGAPIDIYTNVPDYRNTTAYDGFITSPYRLWMLVNDVRQLQGMEANLSGRYALGRDIDAAETAGWHGGAGFTPIGLGNRRFEGQLDGMNHVISGLTIHRPRNDFVGLFSELTGTVKNLGLENVRVTANSHAGAFAGYNGGILNNVYATGAVSVDVEPGHGEQATATAGGLVGSNGRDGLIKDAYSLVDVGGRAELGGIAGTNEGVIDSVFAAGKVGLPNFPDWLFKFGGLVGNNSGQVRNAYWTTDGTGKSLAFGSDSAPAALANSVTMLTTEGLQNANLALDYDATWFRYDGHTAPLLRSFLTPLTISGISRQVDKVYDGLAFGFEPGFYYSIPEATSSAHLNWRHGAVSGEQSPDVGTYLNSSTTTFWSDQRGYLINNPVIQQDAKVTIHARPLHVQANPDTKFFDNSTGSSALPGVADRQDKFNLGLADGDVLHASQSFDSHEAGDRRLTISSLDIRNSAGKDVTSNYLVSRGETSGQIVMPKSDPGSVPPPDPTPGPEPKPDPGADPTTGPLPGQPPVSGPGGEPGGIPGSGSGPGTPDGRPGGNGQGETAGPGGTPGRRPNPADAAGGAYGGNTLLTGASPAEQQRIATLFGYGATQDEDELLKKRVKATGLKNDAAVFIRDGGIHVPGETANEQ